MNQHDQRMAISDLLGWKNIARHGLPVFRRDGYLEIRDIPPDYINDLNAMHDAEGTLKDNDDDIGSRWSYIQELIGVTKAESMEYHREVFVAVHATCPQRAEAFLRAVGKWKDK